MSNAQYILGNPTAWSNTTQYSPNSLNFPIVILPQVIYNGNCYTYVGRSTVGTAPNADSQATLTYGVGSSDVLSTALNGFVATSGTPTSSSTILSALENLTYQTYAYVNGFNGSVSAGAINFNGQAQNSTNITVNSASISVPQYKLLRISGTLDVTTAAGAAATFGILCTNGVVLANQQITIGASITSGRYSFSALVQTGSTANPSITLNASSVTPAVTLNNDSVLQIFAN